MNDKEKRMQEIEKEIEATKKKLDKLSNQKKSKLNLTDLSNQIKKSKLNKLIVFVVIALVCLIFYSMFFVKNPQYQSLKKLEYLSKKIMKSPPRDIGSLIYYQMSYKNALQNAANKLNKLSNQENAQLLYDAYNNFQFIFMKLNQYNQYVDICNKETGHIFCIDKSIAPLVRSASKKLSNY